MTIEQRLEQLEKRNKCLTVALTMTVVAMAATGEKFGDLEKGFGSHSQLSIYRK